MTGQLYTYSMVAALRAKGQDYIDSFWPFVLMILPMDGCFISVDDIQAKVKEKSGLTVPIHSLTVILSRAKKKMYIAQKQKHYGLTAEGIKRRNDMEIEQDVNRRINELILDAKKYLSDEFNLTQLSFDEIRDAVTLLIKTNIELFEQFIDPQKEQGRSGSKEVALDTTGKALISYFKHIEGGNPSCFNTLKEIIYGSIISVIIHDKFFENIERKFETTFIFLDTNYLFSVLGFHFDDYNRPAKELFELIKLDRAFKVRVFDFTVEEVRRVLRGYLDEQYLYLPEIRVDSIYNSLKVHGYSDVDVIEFIRNLEDKLWELGIEIEPSKISLGNYTPNREDARSILKQYKPAQGIAAQNHDLAAIEEISKKRGKLVYRVEQSRHLFLSADSGLAKYNYRESVHREQGSICEVIFDTVFTNLLWLKNPTVIKDIPIDVLVAAHSRSLLIDKDVWRKFITKVDQLRKDGKIDIPEISALLYDKHLMELLGSADVLQSDKYEKTQWILDEAKESQKRIDKKYKDELEKKTCEVKNVFEGKRRKKESDVLDILNKAKDSEKAKARRISDIVHYSIVVVIVLILALTFRKMLSLIRDNWQQIDPIAWLVSILLGIVILLLGSKCCRLKERLDLGTLIFNFVYRKFLQNPSFEELEKKITESDR